MNNCDELRKELANLAGKMIGSAKVQVEYYALRKEQPRIDWLESPNVQVQRDSGSIIAGGSAGTPGSAS